jgi:hypothetical protein
MMRHNDPMTTAQQKTFGLTAEQAATITRLAAKHGRPYWPSLATRANGLADVTFIDGSGYVVTPQGFERNA